MCVHRVLATPRVSGVGLYKISSNLGVFEGGLDLPTVHIREGLHPRHAPISFERLAVHLRTEIVGLKGIRKFPYTHSPGAFDDGTR